MDEDEDKVTKNSDADCGECGENGAVEFFWRAVESRMFMHQSSFQNPKLKHLDHS